MRDGYGTGVVKAGKKNRNVVVLCADLTESTRSLVFRNSFPERFFEIGVAEQNMAGISAGLALAGKIPFIVSYAVFSPGRNWDQIRVSICYSKANVKIIGAHAGISVGPDGATHQALEDIAIMRVLPNMTVIAPVDALEAEKAVLAAVKVKGPVYIRMGREAVPVVTTPRTPFAIGKAEIYHPGTDVTIIACGALVYEALMVAKNLRTKGIHVEVVNNHTIKPADRRTIIHSAKKTGAIVTAEEHQITGGMGAAVAELLSEALPVPIQRIGVGDTFGESGKPSELMKKYHLAAADITKAVYTVLRRKR
ncbi:MAG TPA: transketolase [Candidatus Kerfeldbacteria bacterium]|nr:MAG: Transketolase central region [Parcubacteria group bacterium GW2011_GWA2_48_9]KKW16622.1 MAG: Transketolase central region [Parcubacteria group bacterium GW2011_GWC2_49_9]HCJ52443.1 transketolase [Candidatus Kerfeldbacteria bacterium]